LFLQNKNKNIYFIYLRKNRNVNKKKILKAIKDGQVNLDYVTCVDMANILYRLNEDMDTPFYVEMLTSYAGMGENYWKISYYNSHL